MKRRNFLQTFWHVYTITWADGAQSLLSTAPEVADGVLDDVGPHHLKNMDIWDEKKQNEKMPHSITLKTPCKKSKKKIAKLYFARPELIQQGQWRPKKVRKNDILHFGHTHGFFCTAAATQSRSVTAAAATAAAAATTTTTSTKVDRL